MSENSHSYWYSLRKRFLLGNLGLFVALALVMYLTRKIDWSTAFKQK